MNTDQSKQALCVEGGFEGRGASDASDHATHEQNPQAVSAVPVGVVSAGWDDTLRGPRMSDATGRVIFKYQMPVLESFTMALPAGAEIIRMQDQGGMFWLWAIVDADAPLEERKFMAFKTGAEIPRDVKLAYVGFCAVFVQMELGHYIFEVMP